MLSGKVDVFYFISISSIIGKGIEIKKGCASLITIKEMAQIIGVSPTTVSNVIRGKTKEVSPQMVEKIQQKLKEFNYIPNMTAVNLAKSNSNIIGFVMNSKCLMYDNALQDFFTGELLGGLEKRIHERGYYIMIYISKHIEEITKFVSSWNIDGLVALGFNYDSAQTLRQVYKKPLVFVDGYFYNDGNDYTNVGLEDYLGAYEMTQYLIKMGHRRIGFFSDNYVGVDFQRYKGFLSAIRDAGLPEETGEKFIVENGLVSIHKQMEIFIKNKFDITALFFCTDYYAAAAMTYLMDHGVCIPEEISITGYDDALIASIIRPKLTTVYQNTTEKAYQTIDKLLKLIENPHEKAENIVMPVALRIRDSVKKIEC